MIVCICYGISDRKIKELQAQGVKNPRELGRSCGAGRDCGACTEKLQALFNQPSRTTGQVEKKKED